MNIVLYENSSEKNKINKSLTEIETLTGTLRDDTSIMKPTVLIQRGDPTGFNYVSIPQFKRYYFVDDITVNRKGLLTIALSVDVLGSFKTDILQQNIIVDKSTNDYNSYLTDENLRTNVKTKTDILNFPTGFLESGEFILITAGG